MQILTAFHIPADNAVGGTSFVWNTNWMLIYISLTLATTLICTILIVYRIIRLAQRLFLFRNILSALIESSAMYTLALIVFLAMVVSDIETSNYANIIVVYVKVKRSLN